jgi:hypothetical protein
VGQVVGLVGVAAQAAQAFLVKETQADLGIHFRLRSLRAVVVALAAVVLLEVGLLAVLAEQVYTVQLLGQTWAMLAVAQILLALVQLHLVELIADRGGPVATGNLVQ